MIERIPVVVIGGGVVGATILREFARRGIAGVLVEAQPDLAEGATKANSAIVHTGFDAKPGSTEAAMLRRSAELWPTIIDELGVPFLAVGALMVTRTEEERERLTSGIAANATALGVQTRVLERPEMREAAPYLAEDLIAALSIPNEAIIDPFWLTRASVEAALAAGAAFRVKEAVIGLDVLDDRVDVQLEGGTALAADEVIDAAGLQADEVARLAGDDSFSIAPRKGQFLVSEETYGVDRIVLPIPGPTGKGMLITPIVFGGLMLGPTAVDQTDKHDLSTTPEASGRIVAACQAMVPAVAGMVPIRSFAGLRTVPSTGAYIVRASSISDRLWLACGIRSTGVSASPAVAELVVGAVAHARSWQLTDPPRSLPTPSYELPDAPGEVVCICRGVSRGELELACRRPTRPQTLDAMKRRGGAMFGDCQGNLCAMDVAAILAAERGMPITAIEKGPRGSWLLAEEGPRHGPQVQLRAAPISLPPPRAEVIVVGGGAAGQAAAEAVRAGGGTVILLDRASGWTVTGLVPSDDGWVVLAQSRDGSAELVGTSAVLATGGYIEPREHRVRIAGPRPAGIMTAELATAALQAGYLPGRVTVLIGRARATEALEGELTAAGIRVSRLPHEPEEVAGTGRLEAVRFGDRWVPADTLIFADRRVASNFLLRGLGLVDGRPGIPAPTDHEGRLPLPGLYAAGCCVRPDLDHAACGQDGAGVGARAVAEVGLAQKPMRTAR